MTKPLDLGNPEDAWQLRATSVTQSFGVALRELHDSNPWPDQPFLPLAINHLMTELWDQRFSQTDIREAFETAIADLPRYAGGQERRR